MMRELGAKLVAARRPRHAAVRGLAARNQPEARPRRGGRSRRRADGDDPRTRPAHRSARRAAARHAAAGRGAARAARPARSRAAPEHFDVKFVEQAADLLAERLERRSGGARRRRRRAGEPDRRHPRSSRRACNRAGPERRRSSGASPIWSTSSTRRVARCRRPRAPVDGALVDGLAELRAEQEDSDKRTQSRLANVQDILERLVGRLGRLEDEIARVDDARAAAPAAAAAAAPRRRRLRAPPRFRESRSAPSGAASRDLPERAAPVPPPRALDGADFLLEPGATLTRPRAAEVARFSRRRRARSTPISPPRAAPPRRRWPRGRRQAAAPPASEGKKRDSRLAAIGGQAVAFVAARRRPLLLGLALVAAVAMLAVIELRGGRVPLLQKSELAPPAAHVAAPRDRRVRRRKSRPPIIDTTPTGAIHPVDLGRQGAARRSRWRRFPPACRRRCATAPPPATPAPNSNSRCVCSTAAAWRAIRTPPRNGSSRRRTAACRSPNTAWRRSTKRASA